MLNKTSYWGVIWTLWGIGFVTTVGRAILRFQIQNKYVAEDYLAFICLILLTAVTILGTILEPIFGVVLEYLLAGKIHPPPTPDFLQIAPSLTFGLKLLFRYFHLSLLVWEDDVDNAVQPGADFLDDFMGGYVVFVLVLAGYLACILTAFLACSPLSNNWSSVHRSCPMNVERVDITLKIAVGVDVGSDLLIMLLPLFLLMKARISMKQKIGLGCMFSLGLIIIAFSFVRFYEIKKVTRVLETDYTVLIQGPICLSMWSQIEAAIALLVTNIPAFRSIIAPPGGIGIRPAEQFCGRPSYPQKSGGTRLSGRLETEGQKRIPASRVCRFSREMHSLHSESSLYESQAELGEQTPGRSAPGIMRTMEVNVDSHSRGDELFVSHPFVPPT
ncbi:hypothetical protein EMCG_09203 [[Emmonsia] crescens]|uniref:Rhodopsin domain-containing protein n=1 Tax=[Emmonsia] crescens TaxID=73230 RepID=A0A0G2I3T7_9EURO|nr:hypothetical protein EMCG_09203 [Emmonsia crescens UAMH 3008]